MDFEKLIRFAFASKRRKIMTLCIGGVAAVSAVTGIGGHKEPAKKPAVQAAKVTTTTTAPATSSTTARPTAATTATTAPKATTTTERATTSTTASVTPTTKAVTFSSCAAAKAAGYSDMRQGEPGYSSRLDGDKDGIACDSAG